MLYKRLKLYIITILAKGSNSDYRLMYTVQFMLTAFCENYYNSFFGVSCLSWVLTYISV